MCFARANGRVDRRRVTQSPSFRNQNKTLLSLRLKVEVQPYVLSLYISVPGTVVAKENYPTCSPHESMLHVTDGIIV